MKLTQQQLIDLQDEDGNYSESQVKSIESLTGKSFKEVVAEAGGDQPMNKPDKPVTKWSTKEKLDYIGKYGRKEYEALLRKG